MQAPWFKWIFLNWNRFIANYFDGTKAFVKENWLSWMCNSKHDNPIYLLVNDFLLSMEVATLMQYSQELAGIQLQV
ncbi:hypothetical protein EV363DRAFT_1151140 [Boletus edulis]|nr:hypothetical protein EV363DRAFT_1151140 [Boletus edulis]